MRAEHDIFIWLFAATQFGHDIRGLKGSADLVLQGEYRFHLLAICEEPADTLSVLAGNEHVWHRIQLPVAGVDVTVKEVALTCGDKGNGRSLPLLSPLEDG